MRCKHCNEKVKDHEFWCDHCGHTTGLVRTEFNAVKNLKENWSQFAAISGKNYAYAIFMALVLLISVGGSYWFSINDMLFPVSSFVKYLFDNLVYIFAIPLLLVPFQMANSLQIQDWTIGNYMKALKEYPRYLVFVLLNAVYFLVLKYVCIGDPILNLVRLVMVLYWISIILPAPVVMQDVKHNPFKAIVTAYQLGKETRWQLFALWFLLMLINIIAIIPIGLGLLVSLPFTYYVITNYYRKLVEYELLPQPKTTETI